MTIRIPLLQPSPNRPQATPVLQIHALTIAFDSKSGPVVVVDDVSLAIRRGTTAALVGESGCGKSMTAAAVLRLIPSPGRVLAGRIEFHDSQAARIQDSRGSRHRRPRVAADTGEPFGIRPTVDLLNLPMKQLRAIRGNRIAMVFQDPSSALNPVYTIGEQISEAIRLHQRVSMRAARAAAVDLLARMALPDPRRVEHEYPHRLSGGMKQRAMMAMALACGPALLIADEPTTALDATTQREVLLLLRGLQRDTGLSVLLITHDLGIVGEFAEDVYVMYAGRIVEHAPAGALLDHPRHPYTQALLECTPRLDQLDRPPAGIPGMVPGAADWPCGCRFHPRCPLTDSLAHRPGSEWKRVGGNRRALRHCIEPVDGRLSGVPVLEEVAAGHHVACFETEHSAHRPIV